VSFTFLGRTKLKPILAVVGFLGILATFVAMGSTQDKVAWCHFPPGQWTGNRLTSKAEILSISSSAVPAHTSHPGDGPVTSDPNLPPGFQTGLGADCSGCGMAFVQKQPSGTTSVQLIKGPGVCVCPLGTTIGNMAPPLNVPTGTSPNLSCGSQVP